MKYAKNVWFNINATFIYLYCERQKYEAFLDEIVEQTMP